MRNLSILLLLILATFGAWILATAMLVSPFQHVGQSYTVYFDLFALPDIVSLLIYSVLAFAFGWLSYGLFTGPVARSFRGIAFAALILLFLWIQGAFIISNYRFTFFVREFLFAVVVAAVGFCGFYLAARSERHI